MNKCASSQFYVLLKKKWGRYTYPSLLGIDFFYTIIASLDQMFVEHKWKQNIKRRYAYRNKLDCHLFEVTCSIWTYEFCDVYTI